MFNITFKLIYLHYYFSTLNPKNLELEVVFLFYLAQNKKGEFKKF